MGNCCKPKKINSKKSSLSTETKIDPKSFYVNKDNIDNKFDEEIRSKSHHKIDIEVINIFFEE